MGSMYVGRKTKEENPIGEKVLELRRRHWLSQKQLADRCNMSQSAIASIERGKKMPSLQVLAVIAKQFKTTVSELVEGFGTEKRKK